MCFRKLYLFYNDYETSYTTYINHALWHRCLRSGGRRVGGNRSTEGLGEHITSSHADTGYRTRVAAMRARARQLFSSLLIQNIISSMFFISKYNIRH